MKQRTAFGQHTLPREYFTSEEVYRLEGERIFGRSWLLAGHVSELAGPGSYLVFDFDAESVLVLRDGAGQIRAFHNHCRHRGTRLCTEPAGTLGAAIQCPYHAWTYGLDGALRAAPNMTDVAGFDRADYPLHPVALAEWRGFLFLNLAAEPEPFAEALPAAPGAGSSTGASRSCARSTRRSTRWTRTGSSSSTTTASATTAPTSTRT